MASIVIIQLSISNRSKRSGIAFISFDLSSTFTCPIDIPISAKYALTIYGIFPFVHFSVAPLIAFPSIIICFPVFSFIIQFIHFKKISKKLSAGIKRKTFLKVHTLGIPFHNLNFSSNHFSCAFA